MKLDNLTTLAGRKVRCITNIIVLNAKVNILLLLLLLLLELKGYPLITLA